MPHPSASAPFSAILARIMPFAVYMLFVGAVEGAQALGLPLVEAALLYPVKAAAVAVALWICIPRCPEIRLADLSRPGDTLFSVLMGIAVFWAWIHLDLPWARIGNPQPFSPDAVDSETTRAALLAIRLAGAAVLVPLAEELFWRSFLIRYLQGGDFRQVDPKKPHLVSFVAVTVLFGFEHNLVLAGMMAGAAYNIVLYRTGSVMQCVLSHAVTNAVLGVWVMMTGAWAFW